MPVRAPKALLRAVAALLLAGAGASGAARADGSPAPLEAAVKATYLYKLAPFIDWPPEAFPSPTGPLTVCVQGEDPFGPLLDRAVAGQKVGEHPVQARRLPRLDRGTDCAIAFIGGSKTQSAADAIKAVRGSPVLTVTDEGSAGHVRGIIHFVLSGGRVRFEIDDQAAQEDGLQISSKLLSLAISVRKRR